MLSSIFNIVLYRPIFNLFVGLYDIVPGHDVGLVILVVTIVVRVILYPLTNSSLKAQKSMQDLQPKLQEIKTLYPNDKQKQAQATMELYKNHKINPLSSCLPLIIQLPILLALFWVLRDGLASTKLAENLYSFVPNPGIINQMSLKFIDLAKPSIVLAVLAGVAQFVQAKMVSQKAPPKEAGAGGKDEGMAAMMNKQVLYLMPVMTTIIGFSFPAGLTLYWFLSTVLLVLQQLTLMKRKSGQPTAGTPVIEGKIVK